MAERKKYNNPNLNIDNIEVYDPNRSPNRNVVLFDFKCEVEVDPSIKETHQHIEFISYPETQCSCFITNISDGYVSGRLTITLLGSQQFDYNGHADEIKNTLREKIYDHLIFHVKINPSCTISDYLAPRLLRISLGLICLGGIFKFK